MLRLATALAALLVVSTAAAQPKAKEVSLPLGRLIGLANAIVALDGPERVVREGDKERVIKDVLAYKFAPGFKTSMGRNLTALKVVVESYEKEINEVRDRMLLECKCKFDDGSDKAKLQLDKLNDANRALMAVLQKVSLMTFNEGQLDLKNNNIPVSILSGLDPIIEGE